MSELAIRAQLGPFFSGGDIQGGAKLWHYEAGTNTDKAIWSDRHKVIELPQPLVADANGIFNFFADGLYKLVICESWSLEPDDGVLYTLDDWSFRDLTDTVFSEGSGVQSASTVPVGPDMITHILGSVPIENFSGDIPILWAVFDGSPNLVHSATLILPGSRNRKMVAGDTAIFLNEGDDIWRMITHLEVEGNFIGRGAAAVAVSTTITPPTDGDFITMSSLALVTAIATAAAGFRFSIRFSSAGSQFVYNATSLITPWGQDYRVFAGEILECRSLGSGNWVLYSLNGPHATAGTFVPIFATAADDGFIFPIGTALVASDYRALAKRQIPLAATVLGYTGTSLGATTFVNGTDIWTLNSHGLIAGDLVHLSNSGGALPTGYAASTLYHVVNQTTNTYQLSLTRGGTVVDGTTNGTGTHTLHNKFAIPDVRGCNLSAMDNLGGSNINRVTSASVNGANASLLGGTFGSQTHLLTSAQSGLVPHVHSYVLLTTPIGTGSGVGDGREIQGVANTGTVVAADAASAHSNTQPSIALGVQMRI